MTLRRLIHRRLLIAVAAAVLAGCAGDLGPTAAPDGIALTASSTPVSLADQLAAERARIEAEKGPQKDAYKLVLDDWNALKKASRVLYRQDPTQPIELLGCPPEKYDGAAEIVGPAGGTIRVGPHTLVIPPGALSAERVITAEAFPASLVALDFRPHGLQFQKPAALTLSYKRCTVPTDRSLFVVYVGAEADPLELRPSIERKNKEWVEATIDHFSKYAVAYNR